MSAYCPNHTPHTSRRLLPLKVELPPPHHHPLHIIIRPLFPLCVRREREGGRETLTCHCFHSVVKAPLSWCCCCCCTVTCGHHTRTHTQSYRKTRVRCAQCFCVTVCVWSSTFQRFAFLPAVEIVHTPPPLSLTHSLSLGAHAPRACTQQQQRQQHRGSDQYAKSPERI